MLRYLDVQTVISLIRKTGVEKSLSLLADYLADDFKRWNEFHKSPRAACHSPQGVIEVMPIADGQFYSFKYVNGHPGNTAKHLPTVMAFGVLAETETGVPILLSEMTLLTGLRTASTSALIAKHLARRNSKRMAIIGCGAQSEFQILAFKAVMGITDVVAFDLDAKAIEKLQRNLAGTGVTIKAASSAREAVKGADIVTTITAAKAKQAVLTPDMVEPGMHINGVGGDCPGKTELHPDVLRNARVVVEYEPQTRIEGDIQQMTGNFKVTEFWKIITGAEQGRSDDQQITVFDSVGFAIEDFSALRMMNDLAKAADAGTALDLIPDLADPKDLFALLTKGA
ncbi:MAG: ornithine cyclodeaminase [Alphaproteobacteria bacterium]|nr:ornithine cyclodeaminase [Alphaproteobacteria bacterium]